MEAAIDAARTYLPANLPSNPTYRLINPADSSIMIMGLTSTKSNKEALYDTASTIIAQKLSQIQGVGEVMVGRTSLSGSARGRIANPIAQLSLTMANVRSKLSLQNSRMARGQISSSFTTADIVDNGQIWKAALCKPFDPRLSQRHRRTPFRYGPGHQRRHQHFQRRLSKLQPSVTIHIHRQPGANIIETNDRIRAQLPFLLAVIPQGFA